MNIDNEINQMGRYKMGHSTTKIILICYFITNTVWQHLI